VGAIKVRGYYKEWGIRQNRI